jgi:DNA-binding NtrC family response regulator
MAFSESSLSGGKRTVLCIDDELSCLRFYQQMLEDAGYKVASYTDARSGLEFFASAQVDLAVLDYSMPELDGAEVARMIRGMKPGLPIIMISSWPECPRDAENWVSAYLMKIRDFDELPRNIEKLLAAQSDAA